MAPLAPLAPAALPRDSNADPRVAEVWLSLFLVSVFHVHPNRKKKRKENYKKYQIKWKLINRRIFFFQLLTKVEFKIRCKSLASKFQIRYLGIFISQIET
jgi:hypothetical protein